MKVEADEGRGSLGLLLEVSLRSKGHRVDVVPSQIAFCRLVIQIGKIFAKLTVPQMRVGQAILAWL